MWNRAGGFSKAAPDTTLKWALEPVAFKSQSQKEGRQISIFELPGQACLRLDSPSKGHIVKCPVPFILDLAQGGRPTWVPGKSLPSHSHPLQQPTDGSTDHSASPTLCSQSANPPCPPPPSSCGTAGSEPLCARDLRSRRLPTDQAGHILVVGPSWRQSWVLANPHIPLAASVGAKPPGAPFPSLGQQGKPVCHRPSTAAFPCSLQLPLAGLSGPSSCSIRPHHCSPPASVSPVSFPSAGERPPPTQKQKLASDVFQPLGLLCLSLP